VCLVGPSGCGKSTTLKMVNRLIEPTSGSIYLEGEDVTHVDPVALRRRIGYVIQQVGLFPHQKIRANVATVPVLIGWEKRRASARAEELLAMVGLDPSQYADRYPHQLSGGEQQRVGVARALAADPPVLLMDEPFGAVDPIVRGRLQDEFARLARDLDKTVMFVTHDIDEAVRLGDLVAVLAKGGRIAQYDEPAQILGAPADDFVAQFVGSSRGLRRLAVTPITRNDLIAPDGRSTRLSLPLGASLEEALAMLMRNDDALVGVTENDSLVGVLTPDAVHRALRRSVAASADSTTDDDTSPVGG
jgi:osmoprotectant transport system ATP-binding protein